MLDTVNTTVKTYAVSDTLQNNLRTSKQIQTEETLEYEDAFAPTFLI